MNGFSEWKQLLRLLCDLWKEVLSCSFKFCTLQCRLAFKVQLQWFWPCLHKTHIIMHFSTSDTFNLWLKVCGLSTSFYGQKFWEGRGKVNSVSFLCSASKKFDYWGRSTNSGGCRPGVSVKVVLSSVLSFCADRREQEAKRCQSFAHNIIKTFIVPIRNAPTKQV